MRRMMLKLPNLRRYAVKEKGMADMQATDRHFSREHTVPQHAVDSGTRLRTGGVTRTNVQGTTAGIDAHSGAAGNMSSHVLQRGLGGEAAPATQKF